MKRSINLLPNLGSNPSIELNKPRFKVYSFGGRVVADGGTFEADNCMYNTINNSLFDTASLLISPNGYKEGKLYSVIPSDGSGDLSVTRATTATRVNPAGLLELVPYNLVQYSEDFSNGAWITNNATITSNAVAAPNGTTTADKIAEDNSNTDHKTRQTIIYTGGAYTWSVYAKANERTFAVINVFDGTNLFGYTFNLSNGTLGSAVSGSGSVTAAIVDAQNGWYRCSITFTPTSGTGQANVGTALNSTTTSYTGTTGSGIYIWGAQMVEGSTAKDYQKTETRLNIPRLDYSNGTCPSLLVEPQRTNLVLQSSSFSNVAWTSSSGTTLTSNYGIAPNGLMQSTRIQWSSNQQFLYQIIASAGQEASTIYIKGIAGQTIKFGRDNTVANGTLFTLDGTWQRLELSTNNSGVVFFLSTFNAGNATDFEIWGAQLEVGNYSTSYIPTTSASVTRNADVISKTGISSLIGQTEGTMFVDAYIDIQNEDLNPVVGLFVLNNNASNLNNCIVIGIDRPASGTSNQIYCFVINGGTDQAILNSSNITTGRHKIAFAYKANDFVLYVNGVLIGSDTSGSVPTLSQALIGSRYNGDTYFLGDEVNAAALWTTRLTNTQLAQLTSI